MEKICPVRGTRCVVQEILEEAHDHSNSRVEMRSLDRLGSTIRALARSGMCTGIFEQEGRHGVVYQCGSTELPRMADTYAAAREEENLTELLPEALTLSTLGE